MINFVPLPYRILGAFVLAIAMIASSFAWGAKTVADRTAVRQLDAERAAAAKYRAEVERGNSLSAQLATAETQIRTIATEKTRYVQKVTTGRTCLSASAVGLLNNAGHPKLSESTGKPVAEDAGASATDADVITWGIYAQGEYETCAARLDKLIDWEIVR